MSKVCSMILIACCAVAPLPVMTAVMTAAETAGEANTPAATQAVGTTMAKKANVRFGPSLQAKVVATLDAGTPVEVLGLAQGLPDWYVIRFPREGSAWVHEKVLKAQPDGKSYVVTEDRARARDDARVGGNIVAELALGETVEAKDRARVGAWIPVYPASAVAYVHKSVLNVPQVIGQAVEQKVQQDNKLDHVWSEVQNRYAAYKTALDRDVEIAAKLDWEYLNKQLDSVVIDHPSVRVQLAAKRLQDRIAPVVSAALQVQRQNNIIPLRDVPGQAPIVTAADMPTVKTPTNSEPAPTEIKKPVIDPLPKITPVPEPTKPSDPVVSAAAADQIKQAASNAPAAAPVAEFAAQGFLEERGIASVGTNYVIIDKNGKVCAFVKVKAGVDIQLSEFFWRLVGVKGATTPIAPETHGQGSAPLPLVEVEDVMLLAR
jgi:uncharacterized protein YgiM (DUF1202 family)